MLARKCWAVATYRPHAARGCGTWCSDLVRRKLQRGDEAIGAGYRGLAVMVNNSPVGGRVALPRPKLYDFFRLPSIFCDPFRSMVAPRQREQVNHPAQDRAQFGIKAALIARRFGFQNHRSRPGGIQQVTDRALRETDMPRIFGP